MNGLSIKVFVSRNYYVTTIPIKYMKIIYKECWEFFFALRCGIPNQCSRFSVSMPE